MSDTDQTAVAGARVDLYVTGFVPGGDVAVDAVPLTVAPSVPVAGESGVLDGGGYGDRDPAR